MKNNDYTATLALSPVELLRAARRRGWALSAVGWLIWGILRLCGRKPLNFAGICPYFTIGRGWGGVSFGWFFICARGASDTVKWHEVGHIVQNASVGGLTMLWYSLGSACRYLVRRVIKSQKPYDAWWFESQATTLGQGYRNRSDMHGSEQSDICR